MKQESRVLPGNSKKMSKNSQASLLGYRIRKIRTARGLSQSDLGEKVGLSADRIQQYENGFRKPKLTLLNQIADALKVDVMALEDPILSDYVGVMYALFELEDLYACVPVEIDGRIYLRFDEFNVISTCLNGWMKKYCEIHQKLSLSQTEEEKNRILNDYYDWIWHYPVSARTARLSMEN